MFLDYISCAQNTEMFNCSKARCFLTYFIMTASFLFTPQFSLLCFLSQGLMESCSGDSLANDPNVRMITLYDNEEVSAAHVFLIRLMRNEQKVTLSASLQLVRGVLCLESPKQLLLWFVLFFFCTQPFQVIGDHVAENSSWKMRNKQITPEFIPAVQSVVLERFTYQTLN